MRIKITAFSLAFGILWAGYILLVSVIESFQPEYGRAFLDFCASIYPGYHPGSGFVSVIMGTAYGFVDGAIGGAVFAWIYNLIADRYTDDKDR
jgi:hypothetical protein